jgi:hypothetical protein
MGICRSHVSLSRGHLWLLPMLHVRFVQEPGKGQRSGGSSNLETTQGGAGDLARSRGHPVPPPRGF